MLENLRRELEIPPILHFDKIDSTNKYCMENINNLPDKQIVVSDIQTNGYGRFGRKWVSDIGENIFLSIVLKNFVSERDFKILTTVTHLVAIVICEIFDEYGVNAKIKWPNDVQVNGEKIAGILSQSSVQGNKIIGLVVGMGINLNMPKEVLQNIDKPATSLCLILKENVNSYFFLENLVKKFINRYHSLRENGFLFIKNDYIKRCAFLGDTIGVSNGEKCLKGKAVSITDDGELVMEINDKEQIIVSGEII